MITKLKKNLTKEESFCVTGKSFSEALILASVNPQYDNRLFIELRVQYEKNTSSEHVVYKNCFECQKKAKQFLYTTCSDLAIFMYWTHKSMNNPLSYCGLVDARISASDKDLPVHIRSKQFTNKLVNMVKTCCGSYILPILNYIFN